VRILSTTGNAVPEATTVGVDSSTALALALALTSCCLTTAVTGPPPKDYDFKTRVIGGSGSPLCSLSGIGLIYVLAYTNRRHQS